MLINSSIFLQTIVCWKVANNISCIISMLYLVSLYDMLRIIYIVINRNSNRTINMKFILNQKYLQIFCLSKLGNLKIYLKLYVKLFVKFLPQTMCIHSKRSLNNFDIGNWIQRYITNSVNTSSL